MDRWSFSVLRAHGLQHIHKDKSWRPIVCFSVDCSAGSENHCPTYETVLGTDGQNPNQKEAFQLTKALKPTSKLDIQLFYRSPSKKKAKKRVLVASSSCSMGELVSLQRTEPKPQLRLTTHSSSFTKSKSPKASAVAKRSPASGGSSKSNPIHRLGHATIQVRLAVPPDLEQRKEWRRLYSTQGQASLDTQFSTDDLGAESETGILGDKNEFVGSPTSSKASHWPPSPGPSSSHNHTHDKSDSLLPSEPNHSPPHQPETVLRRRRRKRQIIKGYNLDSDCDEEEHWISESCSGSESEVEKGYHSPTPSHHVDDEDDDLDSMCQPQPLSNNIHQDRRWYTEIIRVTRIVEFLPMMDPGILPTFRSRDGIVDSKDTQVYSDGEKSDVDTASVYSDDAQPEQEPEHGLELDLGESVRGSGSALSLDSESGTLVGSPYQFKQTESPSQIKPKSSFGGTFGRARSGSSILQGSIGRKGRKGKKKVRDDTRAKGKWWERFLCAFTVYAEMKKAGELCKHENDASEDGAVVRGDSRDLEVGEDRWSRHKAREEEEERVEEGMHLFEKVFQRLQMEWTYIGGILVALAAVDTAIFAIGSDAIIHVNSSAISFVAVSSVFTGLGIVCDAWFFLRYAWCDLDTFLDRSLDLYSTRIFFSLSARIPALCLLLSALALLGFLIITAYSAWPNGVIAVCFLVGFVMGLQFFVKIAEFAGKLLGRGIRWVGKGAMRAVAVPMGFFTRNGGSSPDEDTPQTSVGEGKQKVTEPAVGPDSEVWKTRWKKARAKTKLQAEAQKQRVQDSQARALHDSLTRA
ncbi:hypothetical protein VKT23_008564 [Stygiomarasmius scandens]|uniref:Uncharacterized protein n=1 Tax=Marasmiellus scandens TaxID=2682957 RepID=A0ABR1JHP0_9AGAR